MKTITYQLDEVNDRKNEILLFEIWEENSLEFADESQIFDQKTYERNVEIMKRRFN